MNPRNDEVKHSIGFRARQVARVFLLAGLMTASAVAQITGSGTIQGVISDPSGLAIPNAKVTATKVATGVKTERETTMSALYFLSPLSLWEYTVDASAHGFQTTVR